MNRPLTTVQREVLRAGRTRRGQQARVGVRALPAAHRAVLLGALAASAERELRAGRFEAWADALDLAARAATVLREEQR